MDPVRDEHGPGPVEDLSEVMSEVARRLQEEHGDVEDTLQAITTLATQVVPHAEECSISYVVAETGAVPGRRD